MASFETRLRRKLVSAGFFAVMCSIAGCSDQVPTYPVSGVVTFEDGTPVRLGIVEAESIEHGTTATGTIREDGSFQLGTYGSTDGAAAGEHRVIVLQMIIAEGIGQHERDHGEAVDPSFGSYDSSQLRISVEPTDENKVSLEVGKAR